MVQVDEVAAPRVPTAAAGGGGAGVGFVGGVQPVLLEFCGQCHSPGSKSGDIDLTTYDSVLASGMIVGGAPDNSKLVAMMETKAMPPPGSPKPTPEQIAVVRAWVAAGAQAD